MVNTKVSLEIKKIDKLAELNLGFRKLNLLRTYCTARVSAVSGYVGSQNNFKKYSAFELRGRNQNSDKWVPPRIEFCVEPIFPIFEYSVFEILIAILDIFFGPARARGSQLGSRRAARRDRVRARYAESRVCRPWFLAVYFVMNAMSWAKTEARFGISMKNWPRNKLWN